jgi:hypothetical protein
MGKYSSIINKTILPIDNKAIISHIIDQFPEDTRFVVALGYKGDLVRDYLELAHPSRQFEFCEVDWESSTAGPAQSLRGCRKALGDNPFMVIACDGLYEGLASFPTHGNFVGVNYVPYEETASYACIIPDKDGWISKIIDKRPSQLGLVATGVFFFSDVEKLWENLTGTELSSGYSALSSQIHMHNWVDLGTYEKYQAFCQKNSQYDFSKTDEFLYIVGNRVIKWFKDETIARNRVSRTLVRSTKDERDTAFPVITDFRGGFYTYEKVPGQTLYQRCDQELFCSLLDWMSTEIWPSFVEPRLTAEMMFDFYKTKTLKRLQAFKQKYPGFSPSSVNGKDMKYTMEEALERLIDWDSIIHRDLEKRSGFIHGDFQFDNILHDGDRFTLIDWRQDFAGSILVGDTYYDVAKLIGGIHLNYDLIKKNQFTYFEHGACSTFSVTNREEFFPFIKIIKERFPDPIIDQIVSLIFLNMSPLHAAPFDKLLYCYALERLNAT